MTKLGNTVSILILLIAAATAYFVYRAQTSVDDDPILPIVEAKCYIGGCSSEICSDEPGAVSTCEFRPEYACYQTATCERQTNGQCGWTQTTALKVCLANPPSL